MPRDDATDKKCVICGSRFAERKCYFCQRKICTSCIVPADVSGSSSTTKCVTCDRKRVTKVGGLALLWRNKMILGILVSFWLFTVFPIPFLRLAGVEIDASAFQPVLIATAVMTVPFVFMFFAWQRKAPRGTY